MAARAIAFCVVLPSLFAGAWTDADAQSASDSYTLVTVNGEAVTSTDLDELIVETHRTAGAERMQDITLRRLLNKAVNDRLILQQAEALGLGEEELGLESLAEKRKKNAVRAYIIATFDPPDSVSDESVRRYFDQYYHQIRLRQISVQTREEAARAATAIEGGASMDSLAREVSLDTRRYEGGLHNLKYWRDVENVLRDQARDLEIDRLSEPFAFREVFAIIRVEERRPADPDALSQHERKIRSDLLAFAREDAWREFVDGLTRETPVVVDSAVLAGMREDAPVLFEAGFLKVSDRPALRIGAEYIVTETELRRATSHGAMTNATAPFDSLLAQSIATESERLVLQCHAERGGYLDHPDVVRQYERDIEQALIEAYLVEVIAPDIVFNRDEFQEYYDNHLDDFRRPEEVKLAMILVDSEEIAGEIDERLRDGADFGFLRRQYVGESGHSVSRWASIEMFSTEIRDELSKLRVGDTSAPLQIPSGWMVFKLDGRRPGEPMSIEDVDLQLREIMFQKKFSELLDGHLALLRERSEIAWDEEQIARYLNSES